MKVYLDSNILFDNIPVDSGIRDEIIAIIDSKPQLFCCSELTLKELESRKKYSNQIGKAICNNIDKIIVARKWIYSARFRIARFKKTKFRSQGMLNEIYKKLSEFKIKDEADKIHILSAIKSNCTHFLTQDISTIIDRINKLSTEDKVYLMKLITVLKIEEFLKIKSVY